MCRPPFLSFYRFEQIIANFANPAPRGAEMVYHPRILVTLEMKITHQTIAVITGGANGIGLAVARELSRRGRGVALVDTDEEALARAAAELQVPTFTVSTHLV